MADFHPSVESPLSCCSLKRLRDLSSIKEVDVSPPCTRGQSLMRSPTCMGKGVRHAGRWSTGNRALHSFPATQSCHLVKKTFSRVWSLPHDPEKRSPCHLSLRMEQIYNWKWRSAPLRSPSKSKVHPEWQFGRLQLWRLHLRGSPTTSESNRSLRHYASAYFSAATMVLGETVRCGVSTASLLLSLKYHPIVLFLKDKLLYDRA